MLNLKWGLIAGIIAFLFSILLGLINGVHFSNLILRASLFLAIFFVFGVGIKVLLLHLAPELFSDDKNDGQQDTLSDVPASSRVNITIDDSSGYAIPKANGNSNNPEEVGNIEDLVLGVFQAPIRGLDQNAEYDYNAGGEGGQDSPIGDSFGFQDAPSMTESPDKKKSASSIPVFPSNFGDDSGGMGGLLDFEAMARVFTSGSKVDSGQTQSHDAGESVRKVQSRKPEELKGDFSPQELAKGISTVLSKEKEGKV